ncbi:MAG: cyclic nucleotide-binding domain-containing protein [Bdellovibrionia bacterium]
MAKDDPKSAGEVLGGITLLKSFKENELNDLLSFGKEIDFEAHTNVLIEGELSWGLYLILKGIVGIFKTNKLTGDIYDIGQLRTGSFFGEMSLLDENPRSATVRTITNCTLFYLSKEAFLNLLEEKPDLKLRFYGDAVRNLVKRLRDLDDNYVISQFQLWQVALRRDTVKR